MSGIARRTRCGAAVAVVVSVLAAAPMTARAEPGAADIQWAQIFLKEKGFDIGGRANGQMTAQTRAALGAYQRSVGLPATGQLDSATTARIMGEREKKASPTMGSLSRSQVGQTPRDREVAPRAAPTARIDSGNESVGGMAQFGSAPPASASGNPAAGAPARTASAPPASAAPAHSSPAVAPAVPSRTASHGADGPAPQAAPRGAVTAATPAGEPAPLVEASPAGGVPGWMTNGLRYGVMGLVAAILGGIGFAWWRSGRGTVPAGVPGDGAPRDTRVEPSFGSPRRREELTAGPRLTADARRR
ncbi:peptidoglycan-binding domain-containing protein [Azospirillum agricola]|uniref:peptidoglycan-binding domain-containing protein n=1 Tax=Azospirillum agricola TaxID=1720247 RepID=UPI000A0F2B92|nr:peptidoglycan-binding domain-containing protein [Azospirillum agricola]SMH36957.1 Putative peptidoglycan binding domain-containing protein [Azospirillum lipoferum]